MRALRGASWIVDSAAVMPRTEACRECDPGRMPVHCNQINRSQGESFMATTKKAAVAAKKPTTADAIRAANKSVSAALAAGDAAAIAAKYTKTAILMPPGAPMQKGTKNIHAFWTGAIGMGVKAVTLRTVEVDGHGTTAKIGRAHV